MKTIILKSLEIQIKLMLIFVKKCSTFYALYQNGGTLYQKLYNLLKTKAVSK